MGEYLKKYDVILHTVGPVFIGSGKELGKKEYILDNRTVKVIDSYKLYIYLKKINKQAYFEKFLLNYRDNNLKLWLEYNNIDIKDIGDCLKYEVEHTDTALSRGTNVAVMEFMRDAYGLPYVPGSSIKGMLRTVMLSAELIDKSDRFKDNRDAFSYAINKGGKRNYLLNNEQKALEAKILNKLNRKSENIKDAVNDCFAGIRISDSEPLKLDDVILCQRIEYHPDGSMKSLNVLRECIKPGTDIHFTITIDEKMFKYSKEDIMDAIRLFDDMYDRFFRTKFDDIGRSSDNAVYLGGGVGFVSKTNVYPLFGDEGIDKVIEIFDKTNVPTKHQHHNDKRQGVSPHVLKAAKYNGKLYNMGECIWEFV